MKARWIVALGVASLLATWPAGLHGQGAPITVTGYMDGSQENPPTVTGAHGKAVCVINATEDEVNCTIDVVNLEAGATAAHLHVGPRGANGPTVCDALPPNLLTASNEFRIVFGCRATTINLRGDQGVRSYKDFIQNLKAGTMYANVHSQVFPGGSLRGQMCPAKPEDNTEFGIKAPSCP